MQVTKAIAAVPLDRLLVETDAPDQSPPRDGVLQFLDTPAHEQLVYAVQKLQSSGLQQSLQDVIACCARLRGQTGADDIQSLVDAVFTNARRAFGLETSHSNLDPSGACMHLTETES